MRDARPGCWERRGGSEVKPGGFLLILRSLSASWQNTHGNTQELSLSTCWLKLFTSVWGNTWFVFFFFNQTFMKIAPASKAGFHLKKSYKACTAFILSELTFYLHIIGFVNDRFPRKKAWFRQQGSCLLPLPSFHPTMSPVTPPTPTPKLQL